jgi:hypothetical protein
MLLPIAAPLAIGYSAWAEERAQIRAWNIQGPPCPASLRPLAGASSRPPQIFDYAGARLGRRSGAVSCAALEMGPWWRRRTEHVCQFSAPVLLQVSYGRTVAVYDPGVGRAATVRIADGRARCVLGGWFKG